MVTEQKHKVGSVHSKWPCLYLFHLRYNHCNLISGAPPSFLLLVVCWMRWRYREGDSGAPLDNKLTNKTGTGEKIIQLTKAC